jgi:hypothetical protein
MSIHDFFPSDYRSARQAFLSAANEANLRPGSFENPDARAPDAKPLFADCVWAGPEDAPNVVVTVSGTHGVEGFYGSGCQTGWLREQKYKKLPGDVAVLHIHAINPYGFAWLHRVTEGNVDLNRNFVDHADLPSNEAYADIHPLIMPDDWTDGTPARVRTALAGYVGRHGQKAFNRAVMGGQHSHPDGIFYGGIRPVWSNGIIRRLAAEKLARAERIAVLDFHTGLGPYGHAELICRHPPGSGALSRARRWYGDEVTAAQAGESDSPPVDGNLRMAFGPLCPRAQVTAIGIEVGTVPLDPVLMALYADNWLHAKGDPPGVFRDQVMREMRQAFFPDEPSWTEPVYARTMEIVNQAIAGCRYSNEDRSRLNS